jgi:hypothetical protein
MRKLTIGLTAVVVAVYCLVSTKAQSGSVDVTAKIEQAMKGLEPEWRCVSVHTPQGEPGPHSPRGTKYLFRCHRRSVSVDIMILNGESKRDAEKALIFSQRLQINESMPLEGIGEQAYELAKDSFAWITFRNGNVYGHVSVGILNNRETEEIPGNQSITAHDLIDAAKLFARLVVEHLPAS